MVVGNCSVSSLALLGDHILDIKGFLSLILTSVFLSVKMAIATIVASELEELYLLVFPG